MAGYLVTVGLGGGAGGFQAGTRPLGRLAMVRRMGKLLGRRLSRRKLKPGQFKLPTALEWALPEDGVTWAQAVQRLEDAVDGVDDVLTELSSVF